MPAFALGRLRGATSGPNAGLGLSICHQLVSRMDGHIDAICDPGHGTLVWFSVPLAVVAQDQPFGANSADPNQARVLVASDDPVNAQVALALLQRLGYAVDLVASGIEALRAWRTTTYDVCMFDAALPQLDGAEVTACMRRLEEDGRRATPVIGLVAGSTPIDRQRCTAAGMDGLLPKPIELGALMALLARYAPARRGDDATSGHQIGRREGGAA
jgi:CheY-like chemotaxis protein